LSKSAESPGLLWRPFGAAHCCCPSKIDAAAERPHPLNLIGRENCNEGCVANAGTAHVEKRGARRFKSPGIAFVFLCVSLAAGPGWLSPALVIAQTKSSAQQSPGITACHGIDRGRQEFRSGQPKLQRPA
jgi:hypothetical protein